MPQKDYPRLREPHTSIHATYGKTFWTLLYAPFLAKIRVVLAFHAERISADAVDNEGEGDCQKDQHLLPSFLSVPNFFLPLSQKQSYLL